MGVGSKAVRILDSVDADVAKSADNIRGATQTGRTTVKKNLAQSQGTKVAVADHTLPIATVRQLAFGSPADRAQLRAMVSELTPRAQNNLFLSIARDARNPQAPRPAGTRKGSSGPISLSPEGQLLMDITFHGKEPPAEVLAQIKNVDDPTAGVPLESIPVGEDASAKAAPAPPEYKGPKGRELSTKPAFRSTEKGTLKADGTVNVTHSDVHYDGQTNAAIRNAEEGEPVLPIGDRKALAASKAPEAYYTNLLMETAEVRNPYSAITEGDFSDGGVPSSVFAPNGQKRVQGRSVATVRPEDHANLMKLARARGLTPNEFESPEEFARALVAGAHQEGFNVTPITASQRGRATGMVRDLADDPADVTPAAAGRTIRTYMPGEVEATKAAERAVVQEQAIQALARKAEAVFGHLGWGENYKGPSGSSGVTHSTEGPSTTGMTQDPNRVPEMMEVGPDYEARTPNRMGTPPEPKPNKFKNEPVGTESVDPELTDEDFQEPILGINAQREGVPLDQTGPGVEVDDDSELLPGRYFDKDDRRRDRVANKIADKNYEDEKSFAEFNKENVERPALGVRRGFYEQWNKAIDLEIGRSSDVRKEIKALVDSAGGQPLSAEQSDQLAALQQKLRLAERLDSLSGVRSMMSDDLLDGSDGLRRRELLPEDMGETAASIRQWQETMPDAYSHYKDHIDRVLAKLDAAAAGEPVNTRALSQEMLDLARRVGSPHGNTHMIVRPIDDPNSPGYIPDVNGAGFSEGSFFDDGPHYLEDGNPADLQAGKLAASQRDLTPRPDPIEVPQQYWDEANQRWVDEDPWGTYRLDGEAMGGGAGKPPADPPARLTAPDSPAPRPPDEPSNAPSTGGWSRLWKNAGKIGLGLGGTLVGYHALHKGSQPNIEGFPNPVPPAGEGTVSVDEGGSIMPATPEDRIRSLQRFLNKAQLNSNTQTMQNWTR